MKGSVDFPREAESYLTNRPFGGLEAGVYDFFGGIVGGESPSRYSKSPDLWNRFFQSLDIRGCFFPFDLPKEEFFPPFAQALLSGAGCIDLTVTNPYKTSAYRSLASLPIRVTAADRVGHLECLNHIIVDPKNREAFADNTDGQGMIRALKKRLPLDGARVLLVGAGGAAASIGYELVREGAELFIANILPEDAHALAERLGKYRKTGRTVSAGGWSLIERLAPSCDIVLSAITVSAPLSPEGVERLPARCLPVDIRYGAHAEFASNARKVGRPYIDGREMLYGQFRLAAERVGELLGFPQKETEKPLQEIEEWFCREE